MAERNSELPDWSFKRGKLVTIIPIRRAKLDDEWVGDESTGISKTDLDEKIRRSAEVENIDRPVFVDTSNMSADDLLRGF